jgi:hypothetical protein
VETWKEAFSLPMLFQQCAITSFDWINCIHVNVTIRGRDQQTHDFLYP